RTESFFISLRQFQCRKSFGFFIILITFQYIRGQSFNIALVCFLVFDCTSTDVASFFIIGDGFLCPGTRPPVILIFKIIGINDTPLLFTNGNK
ncbi:hypothetical protein Q4Q66_16530, partial [Morganella morganii]